MKYLLISKEEQAFLDWLNYQYPATLGNIELREKIREVYQAGALYAIECVKYTSQSPLLFPDIKK